MGTKRSGVPRGVLGGHGREREHVESLRAAKGALQAMQPLSLEAESGRVPCDCGATCTVSRGPQLDG